MLPLSKAKARDRSTARWWPSNEETGSSTPVSYV